MKKIGEESMLKFTHERNNWRIKKRKERRKEKLN